MAKKEMEEKCCRGHGGMGWGLVIVGLLMLINAYWPFLNWVAFIGIVLILAGVMKMMSMKNCC